MVITKQINSVFLLSHLLSIVVKAVECSAPLVSDDSVDGADTGHVLLHTDPILDQPGTKHKGDVMCEGDIMIQRMEL